MPNVLLVRFDETVEELHPTDDEGNLLELVETGPDMPDMVDAVVGRGRRFRSADEDGLEAQDLDSGATLVTRDATIQVIMAWDIDLAAAYGSPQTIYARGKGTAAAEYVGAGLELRVVDAATRIAELRWIWHTVGGVLKTQVGGHFQVPADGFLMLTATRRWVSSSRVVLRYFLGDALLAEIESTDGDIGGGTTGTTTIGTRYTGAAYERFLDGTIDELRVVDEELTAEEIAGTYKRITIEQPRGYQLLREMHDPGFPMSSDPGSDVQQETRIWGHGLGYASAQAENIRENILPDRAYGRILSRWEAITKQSPLASDSVDTRRLRVTGRIAQNRGVSIPGVGDALRRLLDTDDSGLEIVAFDQTTVDDFSTLNEYRWWYTPAANWTIVGNALRALGVGLSTIWHHWLTARQPVGADGRGVEAIVKITPTTIENDSEVGIMFADRSRSHAFLLGYRRDAGGVLRLVTEEIKYGVPQGATVRNSPAGLDPVWFHLRAQDDFDGLTDTQTRIDARWSFTSASGPFTEVLDIVSSFRGFQYVAFYARANAAGGPDVDVAFDDARVRAPYGDRPFWFYVYRDPADPGAPDYLGANAVLGGLRQAHTIGRAVSTLVAKYDSDDTTYDGPPMGGV
jgi:hypothetical protein